VKARKALARKEVLLLEGAMPGTSDHLCLGESLLTQLRYRTTWIKVLRRHTTVARVHVVARCVYLVPNHNAVVHEIVAGVVSEFVGYKERATAA
jgi:hypothetical protein